MDWERLEVDWERLEKDQQIQLLVDHMELTVFRAMSLGIHVGQYSLSAMAVARRLAKHDFGSISETDKAFVMIDEKIAGLDGFNVLDSNKELNAPAVAVMCWRLAQDAYSARTGWSFAGIDSIAVSYLYNVGSAGRGSPLERFMVETRQEIVSDSQLFETR